jgi:transcriptional regulator with XRE-family HTH domain
MVAKWIEFKGTEATRAGNAIRELRVNRARLSLSDFSKKAEITESYLTFLEEGHEDSVSPDVIEHVLKAAGYRLRAKEHKAEELKKALLAITPANPPIQCYFFNL